MPKIESAQDIEPEKDENRKSGGKLDENQQALAVVSVHHHAAESPQQ
jgi:hypothetical protein